MTPSVNGAVPKTFAGWGIDLPSYGGDHRKAFCPRCQHDRKPEHRRDKPLYVDVPGGQWKCHNCYATGGLEIGWKDDAGDWRDRLRPSAPARTYAKPPPPRPAPPPESAKGRELRDWFAARGIPAEVVERRGITADLAFLPGGEDEQKEPAILFPYLRAGEVVNVKYRGMRRKTFRMHGGAELTLYGLDDISGCDCPVICEGEMDALACEVAGYAACSVPNGATKGNLRLDYLDEPTAERVLSAASRVIIATDNDEPGEELAGEIARRVGLEKAYRPTWPEGCKDANDVLLKHGKHELAFCLDTARPWPIEGVIADDDLGPQVDQLYLDGPDRGVPPSDRELAKLYRPRRGTMTIMGGIGGTGKSSFLAWLLVGMMRDQGWRVASFTPETKPLSEYVARLVRIYAGRPFFDGPTERVTWEEMQTAKAWLLDRMTFIRPRKPSLDAVLDLAEKLSVRKGFDALVIDPWNAVEAFRPPGRDRDEFLGDCLDRLSWFCESRLVHAFVIAHPKGMAPIRSKQADEEASLPVPSVFDISGGAMWNNKADYIVQLWRDKGGDHEVDVHVQKMRSEYTGREGSVTMQLDPVTGRYRALGSATDPAGRAIH